MAKPEPNQSRLDAMDRPSEATVNRASPCICLCEQKRRRDGKGESFLYCGPVDFRSWNGDKPITVVSVDYSTSAFVLERIGLPAK